MNLLRPNSSRAKTAITLIWVVMALEIISFISGLFQYDLLLSLEDGINFSESELASNDNREQAIGVLYFIASVISGITFIQWFRRAYFNLHQKVDNLSHSEGWAAGSWFVPIICLFRPLQIMRELYVETNFYLLSKGAPLKRELSSSLLGLWWTLWIISNLIGQIIFRSSADTISQIMGMAFLGLVGNVIGVVLAFVTVKVIKDYAEVEMVLFELKEDDLFIVDGNLMSEGQRVFMDDRNLEEGNLEEGNIFGKEN
jgi:hypothetical protein